VASVADDHAMRPKPRPLRHPALLEAASLGRTIGSPSARSLPSAPRTGATQSAAATLIVVPALRGRRHARDVIAPSAPTPETWPARMSRGRPRHRSTAPRCARSRARPALSRRPVCSATTCCPHETPLPRCSAHSPQPVPQQPPREPHGRSRRQSQQRGQRPARQQAPWSQPQAQRPPRKPAACQPRPEEATGSRDRRSPVGRS
jgi:hypothetical protein